jgi:hypothetical protein
LTVSGDNSAVENGAVMWRQRENDLSWREIDEEVVILDLRTATYLRLNAAGAVLWGLLEPGATVTQMAGALADRFGLDSNRARDDVAAFVESCATTGLVEAMRAPGEMPARP